MNFNFVRIVLIWLLATLLLACDGGSSGGDPVTAVSGVAASGLAIKGSVTLKDASGVIRTAAIAQPGGEFSIDVNGLAPPFFLKAADTSGAITLYSVSTGAGTVNINPLSNLIVLAAAMTIDPLAKGPEVVFSNPAGFASLSAAQVRAAGASVMARMSPAFQAALSANGANGASPLTDRFQVGKGLDKVFDAYALSLNAASGDVQQRQVANNTSTSLGLVDSLGSFPAAGIYDGTVTMPMSRGGVHSVHDAMITPTGEFRYLLDNGVQVMAMLKASGTSITGTGKAFAPPPTGQSGNFLFADGSAAVDLVFSGTLGAGTLSGSYSYAGFTDTFSLTLNTQAISAPASLARIAGTYASALGSSSDFIGHIEANGAIWGSGPGIGYSGLIQVVDPNKNLYRVTLAHYLANDTVVQATGLAVFHESSPGTDELFMPTALISGTDPVDPSNLAYSPFVTGSHGKLVMQLSDAAHPVFLNAVRLSPQLQPLVTKPTSGSLMLQVGGSLNFELNLTGETQLGLAGIIYPSSGSINNSGSLTLVSNPGKVVLNGVTINLVAPSAVGSPGDGFSFNSGTISQVGFSGGGTLSTGGSLNLNSLGTPLTGAGGSLSLGGGTLPGSLTQATGGNLNIASGTLVTLNWTPVVVNIALIGGNGAIGAPTDQNCDQVLYSSCDRPQLP